MKPTGASAVVTGAGRGIGQTIALNLASNGYAVALQARRVHGLEATKSIIVQRGGRASIVEGDVTRSESAQALVEAAVAMGPLHVAVACAGQAFSQPILKTDPEGMRGLFEVNTVSVLHLLQAAVPEMIAHGSGGRFIAVASTAAIKGMRYTGAYSASKHAVLGLIRSAALEFAKKGITVNAVCPGWVDTPMLDQTTANIAAKTGLTQEEARAQIDKMIPLGKVLAPQDVAAMIDYVVSDAAAHLTGQALVLDGGESIA